MPVTLGHEIAGHLDDGTPVAVWPLVPCGECDRCAAGEVTQCRSAIPHSYGIGRDGGMADEIVVEEELRGAAARRSRRRRRSLVEPIACSLHALRRAGLRGDRRASPWSERARSVWRRRPSPARRVPLSTCSRGTTLSARRRQASAPVRNPRGSTTSWSTPPAPTPLLKTCFHLLRPGGTVALVASYWEPVTFPQFFSMKEPVVVGSNMHGHDESGRDMDAAARVLAGSPEVATAMITHRFPLDRAADTFHCGRRPRPRRDQGVARAVGALTEPCSPSTKSLGWRRSCPRSPKAASRQSDVVRRRQGLRLGAAVQQGRHQAVRGRAPDGPILAVRVEDLGEKEAVLAAHPKAFFTIPHFDGYAAVLIQLKQATKRPVRERSSTAGWRARRQARRAVLQVVGRPSDRAYPAGTPATSTVSVSCPDPEERAGPVARQRHRPRRSRSR